MNDKLKDKYKNLSAYSFTTYNNELVISFDGFENQKDIIETFSLIKKEKKWQIKSMKYGIVIMQKVRR